MFRIVCRTAVICVMRQNATRANYDNGGLAELYKCIANTVIKYLVSAENRKTKVSTILRIPM